MALQSEITTFKRNELKPTTTTVTSTTGVQHLETVNGEKNQNFLSRTESSSIGFIVSDKEAEHDSQSNSFDVEFTHHVGLRLPTAEELSQRTKWEIIRKEIGDGFYCSQKNPPELRCAVFVLKKEPFEQHFDAFAFALSHLCHVQQIDHDDIVVRGILSQFEVIIFPGGLIFDVEKSLGQDGARCVCQFVFHGGGYVGVCAGAFLAAAGGYERAETSKRMIGVKTAEIEGVGQADVRFTREASAVLGPSYTENSVQALFFANGPMFSPSSREHNKLLSVPLQRPTILATYHCVKTDGGGTDTTIHTCFAPYEAAILSSRFGKGRLVIFGPHPEASGKEWSEAIVSSVFWTAAK